MGSQDKVGSLRGRQLLDRLAVLRSACDLDLLMFLARHPRSLLTSDHIARMLGYDLIEIAASLEEFTGAGIVTRLQNPTRVAHLFVFTPDGRHAGALSPLLELASTREGRVGLRRALTPARDLAPGPLKLLDSSRMAVGG